MNLETRLLRLRKTNEEVAAAMGDTSAKAVNHYYTGTTGVPMPKIEPFLRAHGLKVVTGGAITTDPEEYKALVMAASRYVQVLRVAAESGIDSVDILDAVRAYAVAKR